MKVFFINTIAGKTAVGNIIDTLASKVISSGGDAYVATGYGKSDIVGTHQIKIGSVLDRYIHAMCTRINDSHALQSVRATSILIDTIVRIKPDIVHLHNLHGYYLHLPLLIEFLKKTHIGIVITMHDLWLLTGHCASPVATKCYKFADASCHDCPQTGSYPQSWSDYSERNMAMKKRLFSDFNNLHAVVPSRWMSDIIHNSWFCEHPLFIIPNGINTSVFEPKSVMQKNMVLGVANVWTAEKGFDSFIKLRTLLPKEIEICMVGVTNKQRKLLPMGITTYKYLNQAELAQVYSSAIATINMSQSESFGLTTVESMACGTPVISFDNTATHEIVSHDTGILVDDGDIASISKAVLKCKKNLFTKTCREKSILHYESSIMADRYMELYKTLS